MTGFVRRLAMLGICLLSLLAPAAVLSAFAEGAATMVVFHPMSPDESVDEALRLEVKQWIVEYLNNNHGSLVRIFSQQEIGQTVANMEQDVCQAEFGNECVRKVSKMLDADFSMQGLIGMKDNYFIQLTVEREGELFFTRQISNIPKVELRARVERFVADLCQRLNQSPVLFGTTPQGATVLVDGKPLEGTTPIEQVMRPGSYTVVYQLEGHEPAERKYVLERGRSVEFKETLKAYPTILRIEVVDGTTMNPLSDAKVLVDGKDIGIASPTLYNDEVSPGEHVVKVIRLDYEPYQFTYSASANVPRKEKVALTRHSRASDPPPPPVATPNPDNLSPRTYNGPPQCVQIISDLMASDKRRRALRKARDDALAACATCQETKNREKAYQEEVERYRSIDRQNQMLHCIGR